MVSTRTLLFGFPSHIFFTTSAAPSPHFFSFLFSLFFLLRLKGGRGSKQAGEGTDWASPHTRLYVALSLFSTVNWHNSYEHGYLKTGKRRKVEVVISAPFLRRKQSHSQRASLLRYHTVCVYCILVPLQILPYSFYAPSYIGLTLVGDAAIVPYSCHT